jgi:ABC-2 type transport system ATP-binding protein
MIEPLVRMEHARKDYRGRTVVAVEGFDLRPGERVQVVGPNGSGKSTFLRLLVGISIPSKGRIKWSRDLGFTLGFVPQSGGLFDELTLRQNAQLVSTAIGSPHILYDDGALMDKFSIKELLDRQVGVLSDGMKRLVTFLCVWAAHPKLLVADEPLAGIDPAIAAKLGEMVSQNASGGNAYVFSTHALAGPGRAVSVEGGIVRG